MSALGNDKLYQEIKLFLTNENRYFNYENVEIQIEFFSEQWLLMNSTYEKLVIINLISIEMFIHVSLTLS